MRNAPENTFQKYRVIPIVFSVLLVSVLAYSGIPKSFAHFDHFTHYNGRGEPIPPYYVYEALEPDYAAPGEPTKIMFSVQDEEGRDTTNIQTMVEIYSASTGDRIKTFPWTTQAVGDFEVFYTFPEIGNYHIVLSIASGPVSIGSVDAVRSALGSTSNCNCERGVFNASITKGFGTLYNATILTAVMMPLIIVGIVLGLLFKKRRSASYQKETGQARMTNDEVIKYIVMLSAIAGGLVHFAVYSGHASLRLEYSIFLIAAGAMQIAYGVMYVLLTLADNVTASSREAAKAYYRKTVAVNLFGLVGTAVLLGLYAYAVILPPPLSPNAEPEAIGIAGILAKSLEAFLVIGIVYLMRLEKKKVQRLTAEIK